MKEIIITKSEDGIKLQKYIKKLYPSMPDSLIYKLFRKKYFELNEKKADGKETLKSGDRLSIFLGQETIDRFSSQDKSEKGFILKKIDAREKDEIRRRIVYEDDNLIIYDKEEGLLSQGATSGDVSVNSILSAYIGDIDDTLYKPSVVNRLDRNTRGLIIFAKTYIVARELSLMIKEQRLKKYYIAVVNGKVQDDTKELVNLYKKNEEKNIAIIKDKADVKDIEGYSEVKLIYKVIERIDDSTKLEIDLITGKSHQIRAQLAHIGHPIICDKKYMDASLYNANVERYHKKSQELTCYKLIFGNFDNADLKYLDNKCFEIKEGV